MAYFDNPLTRQGTICPLCDGEKEPGLLACWPCYRSHEMKYGNPHAEKLIAVFEQSLQLTRH